MKSKAFYLYLLGILFASFVIYIFLRTPSDKEIEKLLTSDNPKDLIIGAFYAGEEKDSKFIPLLLRNADDPRRCVDIRFKGFSVYQEKMLALKEILGVSPPRKITRKPDSSVIKFYENAIYNRDTLNHNN